MVFFLKLVLEPPLIVVLLILIAVALIVIFTYKPAEEEEIFTRLSLQADSYYYDRLVQHYPEAEAQYLTTRDFEVKAE